MATQPLKKKTPKKFSVKEYKTSLLGGEQQAKTADKEMEWIIMPKAYQEALKLPGIPMGRTTMIRGRSDTGKSTLKNCAIAAAMKSWRKFAAESARYSMKNWFCPEIAVGSPSHWVSSPLFAWNGMPSWSCRLWTTAFPARNAVKVPAAQRTPVKCSVKFHSPPENLLPTPAMEEMITPVIITLADNTKAVRQSHLQTVSLPPIGESQNPYI
jgi:hypothetical protein